MTMKFYFLIIIWFIFTETLCLQRYETRHHHHHQYLHTAENRLFALNSHEDNTTSGRVKGGIPARRNQFPFYVLIQQKNAPMRLVCSGSILSSRWILTAAHCFYFTETKRIPPSRLQVKAGALRLAESRPYYLDVQTNDVMQLVQHPQYYHRAKPFRLYNDIGLIQLRGYLNLNNNAVKPIQLPYKNQKISGDLIVAGFAGYGFRPVWPQLYFIETSMISRAECEHNISRSLIPRDMLDKVLCTMPAFGQSACKGDSGGPVIYNEDTEYVIGVVSFMATQSCDNDYSNPHMHSNVRQHLDFIYSHVGDLERNFVWHNQAPKSSYVSDIC
ncbi:hypothetical protein ILUMI_08032 [Ignelater luminosus]|uniref:Peptidase S1 domain-containing protein n=1 Tax=Ignelater luminosus TaxID=2038154 RepID=A0A8K0D8B8_IGNLU|nr:hypothetical protein ILUMI_08032 [Ignelater luminosus]